MGEFRADPFWHHSVLTFMLVHSTPTHVVIFLVFLHGDVLGEMGISTAKKAL